MLKVDTVLFREQMFCTGQSVSIKTLETVDCLCFKCNECKGHLSGLHCNQY